MMIIPPKRAVKSKGSLWRKKRTVLLRSEILDSRLAESCGAGVFQQVASEYKKRKGLVEIKVWVSGSRLDLCRAYNTFVEASAKNPKIEDWILNEIPAIGFLFETDDGELVRDFSFATIGAERFRSKMEPMVFTDQE